MRKIFLVSSSDTKISSNKLIVNISSILFKSTNNKAMKSVSTHGCLTIAKTSCKKVFRTSMVKTFSNMLEYVKKLHISE